MEFGRTKLGEIIVPSNWDTLTMNSSGVNSLYVDDTIANIRATGLLVEILDDSIKVTKNEKPGDKFEINFGIQSFDIGVAPSLELDGFTDISFR